MTVILLNGGLQTSGAITQLATRQMVPQNFDRTIKVLGVDDINADGLADIVTQQGTAIAYRPRTIPAGQTVTTTQSFNFGNSQVFVGTDGVTPVVLPSTSWSIRN